MRRRSASTVGASLFPFMAVLLCTMGVLILLLVAFARQARLSAAREVTEADSAEAVDPTVQIEQLEWRASQLETQRDATRRDLGQRRLELGHIEEQRMKLARELAALVQTPPSAESAQHGDLQGRLEAKLVELEAQIDRQEEQLAAAPARSAPAERSFAVIPYEGVNETRRRPMYVECRRDGIHLMPEGIVLDPDDFRGRPSSTNALAAALRAGREYLARNQRTEVGELGEPYPLLLVRPDGIEAYYAARDALSSWGSEFGYELIDSDWEIEFDQPNPELAEVERFAVDHARSTQAHLAQLAGGSSAYLEGRRYRAKPGGGGVTFDEADSEGWGSGSKSGDRWGQTAGSGSAAAGREDGWSAGSAAEGGGGGESNRYGPGAAKRGTPETGEATHSGTGFSRERAAVESTETGWIASSASGSEVGPEFGTKNGSPAGSTSGSANGSSGDATTSAPGGSTAMSPGGAPGMTPGGLPSATLHGGDSGAAGGEGLAGARGANWALSGRRRSQLAVQRPIRLTCRNDRLVIASSNPRLHPDREIAIDGSVKNSIDQLVAEIWAHVDEWGLAGTGMYWRPALVLDVDAGGAAGAREVKRLLAGSGLSVDDSRVIGRSESRPRRGNVR